MVKMENKFVTGDPKPEADNWESFKCKNNRQISIYGRFSHPTKTIKERLPFILTNPYQNISILALKNSPLADKVAHLQATEDILAKPGNTVLAAHQSILFVLGKDRDECSKIGQYYYNHQPNGQNSGEVLSLFLNAAAAYSQVLYDQIAKYLLLRGGHPGDIKLPIDQPLDENTLLKITFLTLSAPFKNILTEYASRWTSTRLKTLMVTMNITASDESLFSSWECLKAYSNLTKWDYELLTMFKEFAVKNQTNPSHELIHVRTLCTSVLMIMKFSGMSTIQTAYAFAKSNNSAASIIPDVISQSRKLEKIYEHLASDDENHELPEHKGIKPLGDNFPFIKCLNLPGAELLNTSN